MVLYIPHYYMCLEMGWGHLSHWYYRPNYVSTLHQLSEIAIVIYLFYKNI
uniref:Uncharacterized protein n=1 Tax=Anguilla anguilla TaxID=7936 RepID=A0A0E9SND9_ANGAN